ncbi:MAG: hypothetical protein FD155_2078 [Bacteroidetes bacterium]|nr:MAG: hypothetical protein FD155_2078 [Bacteroidota bacterium]
MKNLFIFIILSVVFFSCRKDTPQPDTTPDKMEELVVPDNFNWKTTKSFQLELTGSSSGIVIVANQDGIPYQKAYLSTNLAYMMKITVPAYEQNIRLLFAGKDVTLELTSEYLSYRFQ